MHLFNIFNSYLFQNNKIKYTMREQKISSNIISSYELYFYNILAINSIANCILKDLNFNYITFNVNLGSFYISN